MKKAPVKEKKNKQADKEDADYVQYKKATAKSKAKQADVDKLVEKIKKDWWKKNRGKLALNDKKSRDSKLRKLLEEGLKSKSLSAKETRKEFKKRGIIIGNLLPKNGRLKPSGK
jgi:hypothetical protein